MKLNVISLRLAMMLLLSSLTLLSYAVPAYPGLIDFKQPNGNIVKIRMKGSETLKWAAIFTVSGICVPAEDLAPGIYVVVLGNQTVKVMVK